MDGIRMGVTEARRLGLVEAAERGEMTNREGAQRARLSLRQFKRLRRRYRDRGPAGLAHGNRGRASPRRLQSRIREQIEALLRGEVRLNDCHLRDLLAERGVRVSAEAVRQMRRRLGLPPKHRRRPRRYYARREAAARAGALVLIDGSPFHWFGPDQPVYSLIGTIDDATGVPLSGCFRLQEDLHGFTTALRDLIHTHGVPEALYGDRTNIAVRSDKNWSLEEELEGRQRPTQFGQMLEELGIRYIPAHSPEAKGRIERLWQTFQDRLTAEFALQGIQDPAAAEAFLPQFFARFRGWFGRTARDATPAWRPAPPSLDLALACRYERTVARDNTVTLGGRPIQIRQRHSWYRRRVEVRELLHGRVCVLHQNQLLAEAPALPVPFTLETRDTGRNRRRAPSVSLPLRAKALAPIPQPRTTRGRCHTPPGKDHPWRKPYNPNLIPATSRT